MVLETAEQPRRARAISSTSTPGSSQASASPRRATPWIGSATEIEAEHPEHQPRTRRVGHDPARRVRGPGADAARRDFRRRRVGVADRVRERREPAPGACGDAARARWRSGRRSAPVAAGSSTQTLGGEPRGRFCRRPRRPGRRLRSAAGAAARPPGANVGRRDRVGHARPSRARRSRSCLTLVTGLLFGLLPALSASRPDVAATRQRRRPRRGRRSRRRPPRARHRRSGARDVDARRWRPRPAQLRGDAGAAARLRSRTTGLTVSISMPAPAIRRPRIDAAALADLETRLRRDPGRRRRSAAINLLPLTGGDSRTGIGFESTRAGRRTSRRRACIRGSSRPAISGHGDSDCSRPRADRRRPRDRGAGRGRSAKRLGQALLAGQAIRSASGSDSAAPRSGAGSSASPAMCRHWGLTPAAEPDAVLAARASRIDVPDFVLKTTLTRRRWLRHIRAQVAAVDAKLPVGDAGGRWIASSRARSGPNGRRRF